MWMATPFFDTSRRPHDRDWPTKPSAFRQVEQTDETGTDPRGFGTKFMPYFRFTELENDIEVQELTLFGMIGFSSQFAMTYEFPIMKQIDYTSLLPVGPGGFPPGNGTPLPTGGGVPTDLEADGDNTGMGDLILRAFYWPETWDWNYADDNNIALIPIWEMTLPTATGIFAGLLLLVTGTSGAQEDAPPSDRPLQVGFLIVDGVYNSELMAPYDIFHHTVFHTEPGMAVFTVSPDGNAVTTFEGLRIEAWFVQRAKMKWRQADMVVSVNEAGDDHEVR